MKCFEEKKFVLQGKGGFNTLEKSFEFLQFVTPTFPAKNGLVLKIWSNADKCEKLKNVGALEA